MRKTIKRTMKVVALEQQENQVKVLCLEPGAFNLTPDSLKIHLDGNKIPALGELIVVTVDFSIDTVDM